jgi:hypothetical protein
MSDEYTPTLQKNLDLRQSNARLKRGYSPLKLTRGQRVKLWLFLGSAKVLRTCRLV